MSSLETPIFADELLMLNQDTEAPSADVHAAALCSMAVSQGLRFMQGADGQHAVVTPVVPMQPSYLQPVELSDGVTREATPILETHKMEAVARTRYDQDTVTNLARRARFDISTLLYTIIDAQNVFTQERRERQQALEDEYLIGEIIRADGLDNLLPLLEGGVELERREAEHADWDPSTFSGKYHIEDLRRHEILVDVLSMCNERLLPDGQPLLPAV